MRIKVLLKFLIAIIDAHLLKAIRLEVFEAEDIEKAHLSNRAVALLICTIVT